MKKKVCMIVQDKGVKGGIAAVISGYYGSKLEENFDLIYVESYKDGGKLNKLIKAICGYIQFLKVLIIDKPDIVHIHSSFGPSFYRKVPFIYMASFFDKYIINHIHGADFDEFYNEANDKKKKLIETVYKRCSVLIALSDEWKHNLMKILPEDKIKVVENYSIINESVFYERNKRKCNNQILFLGEIGQRKGCYDIPDIVEQVVEKIPDVKFIIGGSGDIENIKKLLKEKKLEKNVIFPGWVKGNEKNRLLKESDIFFLPSYNEGMPMAILDAMGYSLPIVSTNIGGIPKIVLNGINGYICNPGDVADLSKGLIDILSDINKLKSYGNESYNIVKEKYSLEEHIRKISNIYIGLNSEV